LKKRLIAWLVLVPFCVALVLFALANRQIVALKFNPFSSDPALAPAIEVPLFVIIYFMLILGVVLGGVASWFSQGRQRRQKRQWRTKANKLQSERDTKRNLPEQSLEPYKNQAML